MFELADSGLAAALNYREYVFNFTCPAGVAASGSQIPLCAAQSTASAKVYLALANGGMEVSDITAAQATALVAKPVNSSGMVPELSPTQAELALLATGLKTFLDEAEALADAAEALVFAVGGIELKSVISVQIEQIVLGAASGTAEKVAFGRNGDVAVRLYSPLTALGSGSKLLKSDGTTTVDLDSDKVIFSPEYKLIAGCFKIPEADTLVLAAADVLELRIKVIV